MPPQRRIRSKSVKCEFHYHDTKYSLHISSYVGKSDGTYNSQILPGINSFPLRLNIHRLICLDMLFNNQSNKKTQSEKKINFSKSLTGKKLLLNQLYNLSGLLRKNTLTWKNQFLPYINIPQAVTNYRLAAPIPAEIKLSEKETVYTSWLTNLWMYLLDSKYSATINESAIAYMSKIRPTRKGSDDKTYILIAMGSTKTPKRDDQTMDELLDIMQTLFNKHGLVASSSQEIDLVTAANIHLNLVMEFNWRICKNPTLRPLVYPAYVTKKMISHIIRDDNIDSYWQVWKPAFKTNFRTCMYKEETGEITCSTNTKSKTRSRSSKVRSPRQRRSSSSSSSNSARKSPAPKKKKNRIRSQSRSAPAPKRNKEKSRSNSRSSLRHSSSDNSSIGSSSISNNQTNSSRRHHRRRSVTFDV